MDEEIWKDCLGYETYFKVSTYGQIYSKRTNKILKLCIGKTGYYIFCTRFDGRLGKAKCFKVHRLIAQTFMKNTDNKPFVNHKDLNKLNNNISNLEWVTAKENLLHAIENGALDLTNLIESARVRNYENRRLSESDVYYILDNYKKGKMSAMKLSIALNVSRGCIRGIIERTAYKDVIEKYDLMKLNDVDVR